MRVCRFFTVTLFSLCLFFSPLVVVSDDSKEAVSRPDYQSLLLPFATELPNRYSADIFDAVSAELFYQRALERGQEPPPLDDVDEKCENAVQLLRHSQPCLSIRIHDDSISVTGAIPVLRMIPNQWAPLVVEIENKSDADTALGIEMAGESLMELQAADDPGRITNDPRAILRKESQPIQAKGQAWVVPAFRYPNPGAGKAGVRFVAGSRELEILMPFEAQTPAQLSLGIYDENGQPTAARVTILQSNGLNLIPEGSELRPHVFPGGYHPCFHLEPFFHVDGSGTWPVLPGPLQITVEKGFEYEIECGITSAFPGQVSENLVQLRRITDMPGQGWYSGDTHIHWAREWMTEEDDSRQMALDQRAADLHVVNVLTLSQQAGDRLVISPNHHPMGIVEEYTQGNYIMAMGEEYRNNPVYGHMNFLGLKELVPPIGTGYPCGGPEGTADYPHNLWAVRQAREQGAITMPSHGVGNYDLVLLAMDEYDSLDQLSPNGYINILNAGFRRTLTIGTDANARSLGTSRTYAYIGEEYTYKNWLDAIRSGQTFVTSGPLLFFEVDGQHPGSGIQLGPEGGQVDLKAEAICRLPLERLEIIWNGEVVASEIPPSKSKRLVIEKAVHLEQSGWLAARASIDDSFQWIDHEGGAHTSPVYVDIEGHPLRSPERLQDFLRRIRTHKQFAMDKGVFEDEQQRDDVVKSFDQAITRIEQKAQSN